MSDKRTIALARRGLAAKIVADFLPFEESATQAATNGARCVAAMLEGHRDAALPPAAASEVIDLLADAARMATQVRGNVAKAHTLLRSLPEELGIPFSSPECPPDFTGAVEPLRAVA